MSLVRGSVSMFVVCWLAFAISAEPAPAQTMAASIGSPAAKSEADRHRAEKYVPGELLVRFRPGTMKQRAGEHAGIGATVVRQFRVVEDLELVRLPAGIAVKDAQRYYRARTDVLYAEPNYYRFAEQSPITPNDPRFAEMWSLHNTGQSAGTPGADIRAREAWSLSTGSADVVVGVIDTGVDYAHPDLAANMYRSTADCNTNGIDDDGNGYVDDCYGIDAVNHDSDPMDDNGHGTHVSGTIGAAGNNGVGVVGINWQVKIVGCKFLSNGGFGTDDAAIECLQYLAALKDRGVNLVATNNSWGGAGFSQALMDAIESHRQRGIVFIAAAGNAATETDMVSFYPANYDLPNIVTVAATDPSDARAVFSNYGRHSVHVAAPGVMILSTVPTAMYADPYAFFAGTSMATPHVTGVAALLKAQDPGRDWKAIKNLVMASGDVVSGAAQTISQRRLNAYNAMTCSDRPLQVRLSPMYDDVYVSGGESVTLKYLSINCATASGSVTVVVDGGPETIIFADDGVTPDLEAGDGVFVAQRQWLASEAGAHTLTFPNNDVLTVHVVPPLGGYSYSSVPFNYRTIEGTDLQLGDDASAVIRPPFPILFGGYSFPTVNVNSNGNLSFGPFVRWENAPLPTTDMLALIAPFWDDLTPRRGGSVRWEVLGTAPMRELVVEWRDIMPLGCLYNPQLATPGNFQVVFFEGSSDILFNYGNVLMGAYDPYDPYAGCFWDADAGASATVGVQSRRDLANQFSYNTASLTSNSSILWQVGKLTPVITVLDPFAVLAGYPGFSLQVTGRSFAPGAVARWGGSDRPTTFVNGGVLRAEISAADVAAAATVPITVFNPPPDGGAESAAASLRIHDATPVPTLTSIAPDPVPLAVPSFGSQRASLTFTLTGADFVPGSIAQWNGAQITSWAISSTELRAIVTSDLMTVGTAEVTVFNPAPGGGLSNVVPVSVVNPAPRATSLRPAVVGAGAPAFALFVEGFGFAPSAIVRWNGADLTTWFLGGQRIEGIVPAASVATVGTAEISVFTPAPGGGTSESLTLSIVTPPANDKLENATEIPTFPFTVTQNPLGATLNENDPYALCATMTRDESVWFRFTPPAAGAVVNADTLGSNYVSLISAWTGSPGSWTSLGCGGFLPGEQLSVVAASTSPIYFMVSTSSIGTARDRLRFNVEVPPAFSLGMTPPSNNVARGTPASYRITLTPQFGSYNNPVALACNVVPAGPTCSLSQTTVTPGAVPATVTITVGTSAVAQVRSPGRDSAPLYAFISLPLLGLLAMGSLTPKSRKAKIVAFLALVLVVVLLGVLSGCGAGTPPPPPQTRDFTVTVTGTSGSLTQQSTVSLRVTW